MCRNFVSKREAKQDNEQKSSEQAFSEGNSCLANVSSSTKIFLPILKVKIHGPNGIVNVRAVIDTGSHRSYVLEKVAKNLGYEIESEQTMIHLLFGGAKTKPQKHKACRIYIGNVDGTYRCDFIALQQDIICSGTSSINSNRWTDMLKEKNVYLTDSGKSNESISLLIGVDVAGKIFTGKVEQINQGITALETKLGWTLLGRNIDEEVDKTDATLMVISMFSQEASVSDL